MNGAGRPARIAMVLPDLRPGGAERQSLAMAGEWQRHGVQVEILLRRVRGELLDAVPHGVRIVDLGAPRVRDALWPLVRYFRGSPPDAVLASMWPLTVVTPLAARLAGFRGTVVASEHSPLSLAYAARGRAHRLLLRASQRLCYPLADARVAVSAGVADDLARLSGLPRDRFTVIHNPAARGTVSGQRERPVALASTHGPVILTVGTLKRVKRHDRLLRAFARMPPGLGAMLCIVGEGPEREGLEQLVRALGLQERVLLPGHVADPAPWYAHADLFVLSSDYEGFGNVLVEAMEHGLRVVSTDCPAGPREILANGRFGRLVAPDDEAALSGAMATALRESPDADALRGRAAEFAPGPIADRYLDLLLPGWRDAADA